MVNNRDLAYWACDVWEYNSPDDFFDLKIIKDGIHTIKFKGFSLDFYFKASDNPSRNLLVSLSGAVDRKKIQNLPIFYGLNVSKGLDCSLLCISDVTLSLSPELEIGWYFGTEEFNFTEFAAKIINFIATTTNVQRKILFGPSAGGFSALHTAQYLKNCTIIVANPQTDVLKYNPDSVTKFIGNCIPDKTIDEIRNQSSLYERLSIKNNFADKDIFILYMQNINDKHHVEEHLLPLMSSSFNVKNIETSQPNRLRIKQNVLLVLGDWGNGHIAPSGQILRTAFRILCKDQSEIQLLNFIEKGLDASKILTN